MYRMYLDEVGAEDLGSIERDEHRYLSLTGVIMHLDQVRDVLVPSLAELKRTCFVFDPDTALCLHRYDIVHRRGIFEQLNASDVRDRFDSGVLRVISSTEYSVISAMVDKLEMTRQTHWRNQHPYHYLMQIMVEKYTLFLDSCGSNGDIMPEARQGKKDSALQKAFVEVRDNGTRYVGSALIKCRLRAENLKFRTKKENVAGLQLCDLIAHPSHLDIRRDAGHRVTLGPFATSVIKVLHEEKYNRSKAGVIRGYGTKFLP